MRSRHHLPVSLVVGLVCLPLLDVPLLTGVALVAYAGLLGTLVDPDNFLIARLRTGSCVPLVRCLQDPRLAFLDQDLTFPDGVVGLGERLASHLVVGEVLVFVGAWALAPLSGVVLEAHPLTDVLWDRSRDAV